MVKTFGRRQVAQNKQNKVENNCCILYHFMASSKHGERTPSKMTPTTTTTVESGVSTPTKITVKRNLFDLTKFERVSLEKEIELKSVKGMDVADALSNVFQNDEEKMIEVLDVGFRRAQIQDTKTSMGGDNFVSPKVVSGFAIQLRPVVASMNRELFAKEDKISTKAQNAKIYEYIKSIPALVDAIRAIAVAQASVVDDDESEDSTE